MVKAGTFDKITKENVKVIIVIVSGTKINWASVIFKSLTDMLQKKITRFAVQINKLIQDSSVSFTATFDGTYVTMIYVENVVALCPKPLSIHEFISIKNEIVDEQ